MRRGILADFIILAVVHAALCILVRRFGFDHVSDDDFARVTIAQAFAHKPKLDPSGTSWLPFPFWLSGGVMLFTGRSLEMARAVSISFASVAATTPYVALRMTGATRPRALAAIAFAILSPWSIWLGATTVPESMTASLAAAGVIGLGARGAGDRRASWWFAVALLVACLSRYEVWPLAAVIAISLAVRAIPKDGHGPRRVLLLALIVIGPIFWMIWNRISHGSAFHFLQRVSDFKRAVGQGAHDPKAALAMFPKLLMMARPDVIIAALGAVFFLGRRPLRDRWLVPVLAVLAQIVFLAYGNMRDGAPAHHPARALLGAIFLLATFSSDALLDSAVVAYRGWKTSAVGIAGVAIMIGLVFASSLPEFRTPPAMSTFEVRTAQIAAGKALRKEDPVSIIVTPCMFEHFALIAEFGKPERVETMPRTDEPVVVECPTVERP